MLLEEAKLLTEFRTSDELSELATLLIEERTSDNLLMLLEKA